MEPRVDVMLMVDRIDRQGRLCKAGSKIWPNVEGWPLHRVEIAVRHGYAAISEAVPGEPEPVKRDRKKRLS